MTIGRTIREQRAALGISQAELAKRSRTEARQIRRYEADETQPSLTAAGLLARALGITLDELVRGSSDPMLGDWTLELFGTTGIQVIDVRITKSSAPETYELQGLSELVAQQLTGTLIQVNGGDYAGNVAFLGEGGGFTVRLHLRNSELTGMALQGGAAHEIVPIEVRLTRA